MISPHRMTVIASLLLVMACVPAGEVAANPVSGEAPNVTKVDCSGLKLQDANGVPGEPSHQYAFKGTCSMTVAPVKDGKKGSISMPEVVTLWAEGKAEWNGQANTLEESVSLKNPQGPCSGTVATVLKCTKDPMIHKTSCVVFQHKNTTNCERFSDAALAQKRPILQGKTTLAEATALSKKHASSQHPPPSPSSSQAQKKEAAKAAENDPAKDSSVPSSTGPAAMFTVEAERLVQANRFLVNAGRVAVQPMAGFGSGWSGEAQLFWSGGAVGAVLDLLVDVPVAATYAVELHMTRAPDYADLKIEVDGKPSPVPFSGYSPTVTAPSPVQAGKFSLQPGTRKVSFMIRGKYQQSTGYYVGIDQIRFYPAGAP